MKEKSAKDNKVIPMTDKLRRYVDYGRLYKFVPMRARISGRGVSEDELRLMQRALRLIISL